MGRDGYAPKAACRFREGSFEVRVGARSISAEARPIVPARGAPNREEIEECDS
jgi:hypothetical protein